MFFIYKITNPKGSTYIGQTADLEDRIRRYKYLRCEGQRKLYHSLKKYGWEAHTFEVIEECTVENYAEREIYWIEFYKSNFAKYKETNGMNLCIGGEGNKGYKASEETNKKNSDRAKARGTRHMNTPEVRIKAIKAISAALKGKLVGDKNPNFGNRWTDEMKKKASDLRKGKPGFASKEKLADAMKKRWSDPEYRLRMSKINGERMKNYWADKPEQLKNSFKNIDREYNRKRLIEVLGRKVICTATAIVFESIAEAARHSGIEQSLLRQKLNGSRKNDTSYLFHY